MSQTNEQIEARKDITCWFCGCEAVTTYIYLGDEPPRPILSITCSSCKEPLCGLEVSKKGLDLLFMGDDVRRGGI